MSNHMFSNEKYGSYVDQTGRLVITSTSKHGIVESCPETGYVSYKGGRK